MISATDIRPGLAPLVRQLREVAVGTDARACSSAVAAVLRACPPDATLLTTSERAGAPDRPTSTVLHAERAFSVVGLVWRPGQRTGIHDHVSWCVVHVVQGTEHETLFRHAGDHLEQIGHARNATGSTTALVPPGDIHRVDNRDDGIAISLHVYGADLRLAGTSVRRTYDLPVVVSDAPADSAGHPRAGGRERAASGR